MFSLWHFNYDVSWFGSLCIHLVWDSLCFLDLYVNFLHQIKKVFFFQINFQFLAPPLLLLAPLWFECWYVWKCPRGSLVYPHFFGFFSLLLFWLNVFFLPYVPNHWLVTQLHPLPCKFFFISFSVTFIFAWVFLCCWSTQWIP